MRWQMVQFLEKEATVDFCMYPLYCKVTETIGSIVLSQPAPYSSVGSGRSGTFRVFSCGLGAYFNFSLCAHAQSKC